MRKVRFMIIDDFEWYYALKSEESALYYGGFKNKPVKDRLYKHFIHLLSNSKKNIYAVCEDMMCVGYIQYDLFDLEENISVGIFESYRGRGYASYAIKCITNRSTSQNISAWIREDNFSSIKAFQSAGFKKTHEVKLVSTLDKDVCMYKYKYS